MKISRVSTVVQHFRAQFRLPGAAAVGRPIAMEIADLAGAREMRQLGQRPAKNNFVALPIMGRPEGAADRMINEGCARRCDPAHDVVRRADHHCRDSCSFDYMGDETDGLVAERSVGYEQGEIDLCLLQIAGDGGGEIVLNLFLPSNAAHKRKVKLGDVADFFARG